MAFRKKYLTKPKEAQKIIPLTIQAKVRRFLVGDEYYFNEHDFSSCERLDIWKEQLSECQQIVKQMNGFMERPYGRRGYMLYASKDSVVRVYIASAVDIEPSRIKIILTELQKADAGINSKSKKIYEERHRHNVL